jgi:hypothetical protein
LALGLFVSACSARATGLLLLSSDLKLPSELAKIRVRASDSQNPEDSDSHEFLLDQVMDLRARQFVLALSLAVRPPSGVSADLSLATRLRLKRARAILLFFATNWNGLFKNLDIHGLTTEDGFKFFDAGLRFF